MPGVLLGNISIFWEYHDILLDNISYHGYSWISKYHISIFIVFIVFTYVKYKVYSLDMNSRVRNPIAMRLKYQTVTFSQQNCEIFTCGSLPISYVNKFGTFGAKTIFIHIAK